MQSRKNLVEKLKSALIMPVGAEKFMISWIRAICDEEQGDGGVASHDVASGLCGGCIKGLNLR
jgi:hypothetical protein